jgi:hypothetical protein
MRLSFAITVCNEFIEIQRLVNVILNYKRPNDEIIIIYDAVNGSEEVRSYLQSLNSGLTYHPIEQHSIRWYSFDFNNNFSDMKNFMTEMCTGDWIVNLDADEIPHEYLIKNLSAILEQNPDVDMAVVPRINTVEGITEEHLKLWGWRMNEKGWINYPDGQGRIFKRLPKIKWQGAVHEKLTGYENFAFLPEVEEFSLYHPKTIERQEKQNQMYSNI